jgi:hypothetical protein
VAVLVNVTAVPGHIVVSLVVNVTFGDGNTVIVIVLTLVLLPLWAVNRTVYVPVLR